MSKRLVIRFIMGGFAIQDTSSFRFDDEEEVAEFYFNDFIYKSDRQVFESFSKAIIKEKIEWIEVQDKNYYFNSEIFRKSVQIEGFPEFITGKFLIDPDVVQFEDEFAGKITRRARVFVKIKEADVKPERNRIFLSHRGMDKPFVRNVFNALNAVKLSPWLDENELVAGDTLDRALLNGIENSAACVFFISKNFEDAGYLADEIDHAVSTKRDYGSNFSIITLRVIGDDETKPEIPKPLRRYVWKDVSTEIQAFIEVARALPRHLLPQKNAT